MNNPASMNSIQDSHDLLVEIGCEELPPKSLPSLGKAFFNGLCALLKQAELGFDEVNSRSYYTPRRLAVKIAGLADRQPDQVLERKGPALQAAYDDNNQPTPAALGFARSVGRNVDELETLKTDKGEWLYCRLEKPGKRLEDILFPLIEKTLNTLPVAKPMRWASNDFTFIRPVHWLVVMHGSEVLDGELFALKATNQTRGHRIHSPGPHVIPQGAEYEAVLETACVVACQEKRKEIIRQQAFNLGESHGGTTRIDASLLEEVTNLVEWPKSIIGSFDEEFLQVPAEALVASMQDHQKFFPVTNSDNGQLQARFIAVANLDSEDFAAVTEGFERVIRPRLADARFFWEQDQKAPLEDSLTQLDSIVFQKNLGTVGDKSRRLESISKKLADVTNIDHHPASRAALLCKCDLVSQMVGEFPELQGIMGDYYARQSGESQDVSTAIGEHYLPAYSGDRIPSTTAGKVVALADRLDTLTGIFATGAKPTGNKDPFALRRAALGVLRILLDGELSVTLDEALSIAVSVVEKQLPVSAETLTELRHFITERLKHYLREQSYETSLVNAALDAPLGTLPDLVLRLDALNGFMQHKAATGLAASNKRIGNILRKSGKDEKITIDEDLLVIDEEKYIFDEINRVSENLGGLCERGDYTVALELLASLSPAIDAFFDKVMVMDENPDIRQNRLGLLASLKGLFDRIANLALIG